MIAPIPYAAEVRPDTGVSNATLGIWLFLASEVMLFASLFSAYVLLRSGAETWPDQSAVLSVPLGTASTVLLGLSSVAIARARSPRGRSARTAPQRPYASCLAPYSSD